MNVASPAEKIQGDWYPGSLPLNAEIDVSAYVESAHSFSAFRSNLDVGFRLGLGSSVYMGCMFDVGVSGRVSVGDYSLLHGVWLVCDSGVEIGDHALISWNVVLMDSYRMSRNVVKRRSVLERLAVSGDRRLDGNVEARPISIGNNVWIGFDSCVLPGVTIGDGAVVGARSVITDNVDAYTVVAGNPARTVRRLRMPNQAKGS